MFSLCSTKIALGDAKSARHRHAGGGHILLLVPGAGADARARPSWSSSAIDAPNIAYEQPGTRVFVSRTILAPAITAASKLFALSPAITSAAI